MNRQAGILNVLVIPVVILSVLVAGLGAFGVWAYLQYKDYKGNVDKKISVAVADAKLAQQKELEVDFAEREKQPTRQFKGPSEFGTLSFKYPKTWSVFVENDGSGGAGYEAYYMPLTVPPINAKTNFALRVTIQNKDYSTILKSYQSQLKTGALKSSTIKLKGGQEGIRLDGQFNKSTGQEGTMVLFQLRDKTVQVYTQSKEFVPDFDKIILPELNFIA